MDSTNSTGYDREKYNEIAKKSLIRVQYSCSGNSDCYDESLNIPIVNNKKETNDEDEIENS
jgi:hypothetical protein